MPGIFVDIYFLKATILNYYLQLVGTLNVGALSTHGTLYIVHICKLQAQTVIKTNGVHGKNYII